MSGLLGFIELGAIVFAWIILWNFVVRGFTGLHGSNPAAQGLAAIVSA